MSWDFETDPEFQAELDWVEAFVRDEVEPLDLVIRHAWDMNDPVRQELIPPLQDRARGLWAPISTRTSAGSATDRSSWRS